MADNKHSISELYQLQALPLNLKVSMTKRRIRDWVKHFGLDGVYVSFSGGKDSTVLLHIAREMYGDAVKAVFIDTGLEYPEIRSFVKTFDNVDIVRPKMGFKQVCEKYGFPLISKEVSESVYGARKYLTSIMAEINASTNERTNERTNGRTNERSRLIDTTTTKSWERESTQVPIRMEQTQRHWEVWADKESLKDPHGGGYDNKYRKLRGIGEYSKQGQGERADTKNGNSSRDADKRQSDKGEYP